MLSPCKNYFAIHTEKIILGVAEQQWRAMELYSIIDTEKLFPPLLHTPVASCDYGAATRSKMFRCRNIVRRHIFVRCNGESSSKIDFVDERSRVKINMHRRNDGSSSYHWFVAKWFATGMASHYCTTTSR